MYPIVQSVYFMAIEMKGSSGFPLWEDGMIPSKVEE